MSALTPCFGPYPLLLVNSTSCSLLHCWAPLGNCFPQVQISDGFWGIIYLSPILLPLSCRILQAVSSFSDFSSQWHCISCTCASPSCPKRSSSVETSYIWNQLYLKQWHLEENNLGFFFFFHYGSIYLKATGSVKRTSDLEYSILTNQKSLLALWFGKWLQKKIWNNLEVANVKLISVGCSGRGYTEVCIAIFLLIERNEGCFLVCQTI